MQNDEFKFLGISGRESVKKLKLSQYLPSCGMDLGRRASAGRSGPHAAAAAGSSRHRAPTPVRKLHSDTRYKQLTLYDVLRAVLSVRNKVFARLLKQEEQTLIP